MFTRHSIRKKLVFAVYQEYIASDLPPQKSNILQTFRYYCQESKQILATILDLLLQITAYSYEAQKPKQLRKTPRVLKRNSLENLRSPMLAPAPPRLALNPINSELLAQLQSYKRQVSKSQERLFDEDIIKRLFYSLAKTQSYTQYLHLAHPQPLDDSLILKFILTQVIMPDAVLADILEANFLMSYEDAELACNHLLRVLQIWATQTGKNLALFPQLSDYEDFPNAISEILEREYQSCQQLLFPKIQHWDEHRICSLDKILLLLGLCEILYYPQVPVRVVINEYIEIAKEYSTEKSKGFINGILDALLQELIAEGKIPPSRL